MISYESSREPATSAIGGQDYTPFSAEPKLSRVPAGGLRAE
jgi:hypothetical protein